MENLNRIVESMRELEPEAAEVAQAAARVRAKLFGAGADGVDRIKGCADFQSLFTSYLTKTLSDTRRMLVEDHLHTCVNCRRSLEELQGTRSKVLPFVKTVRPANSGFNMKWAIAAAVTMTAGLTAWTVYRTGPGSTDPVFAIQQVDGSIYQLASTGALPAGQGQELLAGEQVRTPIGSKATLRLFDGSLIEMNERSELSVVRDWRSTRIRLDRGNIIVQAAKQKRGTLQVASGEAVVTVRGTIFSVNRGTRGTRVSVVEGAVEVAQAGRAESLKPGGQTTTDASLGPVPVKEEIAWSKDAARYLALLGELSALEKKIDAIPAPALRYTSKLTPYIPADASVFVAIPNIGGTLGEFKRLFDDQLRESPQLREWWQAQSNSKLRSEVELAIARTQKLAGFIGDEVTVSLAGSDSAVLVMAEVRKDGIREFLQQEVKEFTYGRDFTVQKNVLIVASRPERLAQGIAAVGRGGAAAASGFRARIDQAYRGGAGWLICADMEQIVQRSVQNNVRSNLMTQALGFDNARYLVLERRDVAGRTNNSATLNFAGERRGLSSWLAQPGPLKTLEYVSPNAGMALSAVTKNPRLMLEDIFRMASSQGSNFQSDIAAFERKVGVNLVNDLAGALGSEVTFALDGPVLPTPAWKMAFEVLAPQRLQSTIEKMVDAANRELALHPDSTGKVQKVVLKSETVSGRVFYSLSLTMQLPVEIHYSYADGYLVAGSSRGQVSGALDTRRNGINLARSEKFRNALPYGSNPNFSAVLYHDLGGALGPVAEQLKATGYGTADFQKGLDSVKDMKATMVGIYSDGDRITASSTGSLFGLNLGMLASLQSGKLPMVLPHAASEKAPAETTQ